MRKIIAVSLVIAAALWFTLPALAQTDQQLTPEALLKIIQNLLNQVQELKEQIQRLQVQTSAQPAVTQPAPPPVQVGAPKPVPAEPIKSAPFGAQNNPEVRKLQRFLIDNGYLKIAAPTGFYLKLTQEAVRKFQADNELPPTGIADEETLNIINKQRGIQSVIPALIEQGAGESGQIPPGLLIAPGLTQPAIPTTSPSPTATPLITPPPWPYLITPWPMFGNNPLHSGRTQAVGPQTPNAIKTIRIGSAHAASPIVGLDGTLYMIEGSLNAYDQNGTKKWAAYSVFEVHGIPAQGMDGTIYVYSKGVLHAFSQNGTAKWKLSTPSIPSWDTTASPTVAPDGTIYVGSYAVNPDGTVKWVANIRSNGYATVGPDGTIYISSLALNPDGSMKQMDFYALHPDGSKKWGPLSLGKSPWGPGPAIDAKKGIIYKVSLDKLYAITPLGTVAWVTQLGGLGYAPALGHDGTIYVPTAYLTPDYRGGLLIPSATGDSKLYALNPDGSIRWKFQAGHRIMSKPAVDGNGVIYFTAEDEFLYAVNPSGELKWKIFIGESEATPAITDGKVVVSAYRDANLYIIGSTTPPAISTSTPPGATPTPAVPAVPAQPAVPGSGPAVPAIPAIPAQPAQPGATPTPTPTPTATTTPSPTPSPTATTTPTVTPTPTPTPSPSPTASSTPPTPTPTPTPMPSGSLTVSNYQVTNITPTSADVSFTTSQPATARISRIPTPVPYYGGNWTYFWFGDYAASRTITLTGLNSNTEYFVGALINSTSATIQPNMGTFRTLPASSGDTTAPVISNVQVTNVSGSSATFTWATNEASDSVAEIVCTCASTPTVFANTMTGNANTTSHTVMISNSAIPGVGFMSQGQSYNFRVSSADAAGNRAYSPTGVFTANVGGDTSLPNPTPTPTPQPSLPAPTYIRGDWSYGWADVRDNKMGQKVVFQYPTDSASKAITFRLYQKRPTDSSFVLAAEFSGMDSSNCTNKIVAVGEWILDFNSSSCGTSSLSRVNPGYTTPYISGATSFSANSYSVGEYSYYVAAVDANGSEGSSSPTTKLVFLQPLNITSPSSVSQPALTSPTPAFQWSNGNGWPVTPNLGIYVFESTTGYSVNPHWSISWATGAANPTTYSGPVLDPAKVYRVSVFGIKVDTSSPGWTSYVAMPSVTVSFQPSGSTSLSKTQEMASLISQLTSLLKDLSVLIGALY